MRDQSATVGGFTFPAWVASCIFYLWRGWDSNPRPPSYEPGEIPTSPPRYVFRLSGMSVFLLLNPICRHREPGFADTVRCKFIRGVTGSITEEQPLLSRQGQVWPPLPQIKTPEASRLLFFFQAHLLLDVSYHFISHKNNPSYHIFTQLHFHSWQIYLIYALNVYFKRLFIVFGICLYRN